MSTAIAYDDFCFGDTGSMFGHSPEPIAEAIARAGRARPHLHAADRGRRRWSASCWPRCSACRSGRRRPRRPTPTASCIRWCRAITKRAKILVFHGCYHGAADDTFVRLKDGKAIHRPGLLGQVFDVTQFTKVVEFNDVVGARSRAGSRAMSPACLTEPALTNIGMVLPEPGFLEALRDLTRKHGTLLVIDETHTISTGYGGYTRTHELEPDFLTVGKPIAGGIPCSVFGFTAEIEARMRQAEAEKPTGLFRHGHDLQRQCAGAACDARQSGAGHDRRPPTTTCCRCRSGWRAAIEAPDQGAQPALARLAMSARAPSSSARRSGRRTAPRRRRRCTRALELAIHLYLLNRGFIIAPFHNMTLVSPATTRRTGRPADRDRRRLLRRIAGRLGRPKHDHEPNSLPISRRPRRSWPRIRTSTPSSSSSPTRAACRAARTCAATICCRSMSMAATCPAPCWRSTSPARMSRKAAWSGPTAMPTTWASRSPAPWCGRPGWAPPSRR